jgi:hypothetical protein
MITDELPDDSTKSEHEIHEFVSRNRIALDRGRLGLTRSCRVPVEFSSSWISAHTTQIMATRSIARAFCAEGNLAKMENRPWDAGESYLSAIKMGAVVAHGDVMIDGLMASACDGEGMIFLDRDLPSLNAGECRKLIAELESVESEQEPTAEIIKHERMWARGVLREPGGLKSYLHQVAESHSLNPDESMQKYFAAKYDARLQKELQLKAKLAARAYTLEAGHPPVTWNDLVPAYLKSVPNFPFSPGNSNLIDFQERHSGRG